MPIVTLGENFVANHLVCPDGKVKIEYVSHDRSGLYILVSATSPGIGTFFLRQKLDGKSVHIKLGRTTDIGLDTAREKARKLRAQIALGADPSSERKAARTVLTFSDFFEDHYLPFAEQRKRTWKRDQELFNRRLKPIFGNKKLESPRVSRRLLGLSQAALAV